MNLVRLGTLEPDAIFRTTLTRRVGVVLGPVFRGMVPVYLDALPHADVFEEKFLPPSIIVAVDGPAATAERASLVA